MNWGEGGSVSFSWALIGTPEHQGMFQAALGEENIGRNHPQERQPVKLGSHSRVIRNPKTW